MRLFLALSYPEAVGGVVSIWRLQRYISASCDLARERERERESNLRLKILLSYWYYKDTDLDALFKKYFSEPYPEVFADSGAFSAATQGAQITTGEYATWVKKYKHLFSVYSNLDVIGNAQKTLENQKRLEDIGINPLPVFHAALDYSPLQYYLDAGYHYIALGGLVPYASQPKVRMRFLVKAFQMAKDRAVFHGFGITSWEVMSRLPWYSVDSSSWGSGFRFGTVPLFDVRMGKFEKAKLGDKKTCSENGMLFEEHGFDWRDFADRKRNDRAKICAVSALAYIRAEQYLQRKFGKIYIPSDGSAPAGLRAYLADANPARIGEAEAGLRLHLADARGHTAADLSAAEHGLRLHLAEHSLDRGGVGDTSRAMEILK